MTKFYSLILFSVLFFSAKSQKLIETITSSWLDANGNWSKANKEDINFQFKHISGDDYELTIIDKDLDKIEKLPVYEKDSFFNKNGHYEVLYMYIENPRKICSFRITYESKKDKTVHYVVRKYGHFNNIVANCYWTNYGIASSSRKTNDKGSTTKQDYSKKSNNPNSNGSFRDQIGQSNYSKIQLLKNEGFYLINEFKKGIYSEELWSDFELRFSNTVDDLRKIKDLVQSYTMEEADDIRDLCYNFDAFYSFSGEVSPYDARNFDLTFEAE